MASWNHRYLCYARAHGKTPEEMVILDKQNANGLHMLNFAFWNDDRLEEWKSLNGLKQVNGFTPILSENDFKNYDAWLERVSYCSLCLRGDEVQDGVHYDESGLFTPCGYE